MHDVTKALKEAEANGEFSFALESEQVVLEQTSGGGSGSNTSDMRPPEKEIQDNRDLVDSDPTLAEGVDILVDYILGDGHNIAPRNIPGTDAQLTSQDIAETKQMVESANLHSTLDKMVRACIVEKAAYIEINWTDKKVFKPKLVPSEFVTPQLNEFGEVVGYEVEDPNGGDSVELGKYDMAHLWFFKRPSDDFPRALIERVEEQTRMLRDMEIDMARFVATKAYPPILWKLGNENNEWNPGQIQGWLDEVSQVEPDSMLAAPHDVEAEAVGVGDSSTSQGALDLTPTFEHLESRMATGLGLPYFMLNGDGNATRNETVGMMPKFHRRIQRLRGIIQDMMENQVLHSLYYHQNPEEHEGELVPKFEFGSHSSEEDRLEVDKGLKLFNNGFLTRKAFAERVGIDPETEMPSVDELKSDILPVIQQLASKGDNIQNPDGGSPTDTGGGADSAGGEAKTRDKPEKDSSGDDSRNKQDLSDGEQA